MKILLTFSFLFFSSLAVAELPTSLFGVQLNDFIKNYIEEGDKINPNDSPDDFIKWSYSEDKIKNFIKNSNFEYYIIFQDEYDIIVSILGFKFLININVPNCVEEVNNFSNILKTHYALKKEFVTNFYTYTWSDDTEPLEKDLHVVYEKQTGGVMNGKKYSLRLACDIQKSTFPEQLDANILLELSNNDWFERFANKYDYRSLPDLDSFMLHSELITNDLSGL